MVNTAKSWTTVLPPTLFSILARSEMCPLYLDVLVTLLDVVSVTGKLTYIEAKERTENILSQYGLKEIARDVELDDPVPDAESKVSFPGVIIRRLEKAGWIRRDADRITGDDMVRIPPVSIKLIRAFIDIREGAEVEYDAHLISILKDAHPT